MKKRQSVTSSLNSRTASVRSRKRVSPVPTQVASNARSTAAVNEVSNEPAVGESLRQMRTDRGLSLDRLSNESGVSRAMLSQIELGHSAPTITVLWRIARALGVPFSALLGNGVPDDPFVMRADRAKVLRSADGAFSSRALFPLDRSRWVEFYELRLNPRSVEVADAHAPGTTENLVVTAGYLEVIVGGRKIELSPGDATYFLADIEHQYHNPGSQAAIAYLVMTYTRSV